jgi:anti-sigma B factor antagonist
MPLSASDAITTSVERGNDYSVVAVGGVVDLATAAALEQAIDGLIAESPPALIVDLSAVDFLASVGLKILVATQEQLKPPARFAVVASGPATSRPIQLTRLDEVFGLYPTLTEAVKAVQNNISEG